MNTRSWRRGSFALFLAVVACSSDPPQMQVGPTGIGGYTAPPVAGAAGKAPGAAGSTPPPVTTAGHSGVAGTSPVATGGVSGSAIAGQGVAGSAGAAGKAVAGASGGSAGAAGAAGSTTPTPTPSGDAIIREADPTDASVGGKGEYEVKTYTGAMGIRDGADYGPVGAADRGATIYYPAGAAKPPFGGVVIVPGFTAVQADMAAWGPFLASHGIVAMTIDTITTGDQPDARSLALLDALVSLREENKRMGSPLAGNLDVDRLGIMGWSMGGGGTWITADGHPELKVAISLCGWILGAAGSKTTVPSLQLASKGDPLADGMSQPIYDAIPAKTPKMLIEFPGGDHWNANNPANSNKQIGRYGLSWIKVFLEGDTRYRKFLEMAPLNTTDFKTNQMGTGAGPTKP
ncbi:MAG: Lipase 1 [Pseudomonadota bacterium]